MRSGVCADVEMFMQWNHRDRNTIEDLLQDLIALDVIGEGFIGKHQSVTDDIQRHVEHILRKHISSAAYKCQRLGREDQVDRSARTGAEHNVAFEVRETNVFWLTCRRDD